MEKEIYKYDYKNKCDCSEDDNCGCTYPNNMGIDFDYEEQNELQRSWQVDTKISLIEKPTTQKDK